MARLAAVLLPGLVGLVVMLSLDPLRQDLCYHDFADQRTVWGIPYFGDVVTNLPFCLAGALGLLWLLKGGGRGPFVDQRERWPFLVFFAGVFLTGLGSGYYHLDPTNATLVWDRLPMTLAFMGFFTAMIVERLSRGVGLRLLWPLVALGAASVGYWAWRDDLRFYALVQFYPLLATALLLLLYPTPYSHGGMYWAVIGFYLGSKAVELLDRPVMDVLVILSGHNLKHLLAAVGAWWVLRMLQRREVANPEPSTE